MDVTNITNMSIIKVSIDLKAEGEKRILQLLDEHMIMERGRILSPNKSVWFKHIHYLRFARLQGDNGLSYFYSYSSKKDLMLEGKELTPINFKQLKEMLLSRNY